MNIVLFDFDGTLTKKDSFLEFIKFSVGKRKFYLGLMALLPTILLYKLGFIKNYCAKLEILNYFFKDKSIFYKKTNSFKKEIYRILRDEMYERLKWHKKNEDLVVIVSASLRCYLKDWCKEEGIELIATEIEFADGKITYKTKNCYGKQKVVRIREKYDLDKYDEIFAYGDSKGDLEMLNLADNAFYRGEIYK